MGVHWTGKLEISQSLDSSRTNLQWAQIPSLLDRRLGPSICGRSRPLACPKHVSLNFCYRLLLSARSFSVGHKKLSRHALWLKYVPVQGWSSIIPKFTVLDFISLYIELPVMVVMTIAWLVVRKLARRSESGPDLAHETSERAWSQRYTDLVDVNTVDLRRDEYVSVEEDTLDDLKQDGRLKGRWRWAWGIYYWVV